MASEIRALLSPKIQSLIRAYPSVVTCKLKWGEMDMFGHLNNVYHARYFEVGRVTYYEQILEPHLKGRFSFLSPNGIGPILKDVYIKYKFPIEYPDTLVIANKISDIKNDRWTHNTLMLSVRHENIIAECSGVIVCYDHFLKKKAMIPKELLDANRIGTMDFEP
jgi:acyl-CoA thioester hydrolase